MAHLKKSPTTGHLLKNPAGRLAKSCDGGPVEPPTCSSCGGCCFSDASYWTWAPPTLATSGWYYYGYDDLNEAASRFNAWTAKNQVGNYARITDTGGTEVACSWTLNSEPWEYSGYDGDVLYRWAIGIHLGAFLKAELQVSFDTVTPVWFGVGFGVRSVGTPSPSTCCRMEWADSEIFHNAGPDNVPPDPATTSLGAMVANLSNNKCCKCRGGGCVPTADGSDSECDDAGVNECTEEQDDECPDCPCPTEDGPSAILLEGPGGLSVVLTPDPTPSVECGNYYDFDDGENYHLEWDQATQTWTLWDNNTGDPLGTRTGPCIRPEGVYGDYTVS